MADSSSPSARPDTTRGGTLPVWATCIFLWCVVGWIYAFNLYAQAGMFTTHASRWSTGNVIAAYLFAFAAGVGGPVLPLIGWLAGAR